MAINSNRKLSFFIAIAVVLIVPLLFFYIFAVKPHPTLLPESVLPIFGPRQTVERLDIKGKTVVDTIYHSIPDFSFLSQTGDTITKEHVSGKVFVTDFFFTTCPTICIDMTRNLRKLQDLFLTDDDVMIVSHTVDPQTDSVGQLYQYAIDNGIDSKKWLLLTGEKKALYDIARYGYYVTAMEGDGGPHDFIHSERLILIDKEGRIRGYYDGTSDEEVEKLIADTKLLLVSYIVPRKEKK
jgi:protein SCO1